MMLFYRENYFVRYNNIKKLKANLVASNRPKMPPVQSDTTMKAGYKHISRLYSPIISWSSRTEADRPLGFAEGCSRVIRRKWDSLFYLGKSAYKLGF